MAWGIEPDFDQIPQELRAGRWGPWRAVQRANGKMDKIPAFSTAKPQDWLPFDDARHAQDAGNYDGIGRLCDPADPFVVLDVDHCLQDGVPDAVTAELVRRLDTYTEISPSGTGLRLVVRGEIPSDVGWTQGGWDLEMYAGHKARYVTFTGHLFGGVARLVRQADLAWLHGRLVDAARAESTQEAADLPQPELAPPDAVPALVAKVPLATGHALATEFAEGQDRSLRLTQIAHQLYDLGLSDGEVLAVLRYSPGSWAVALDHRQQDEDKALAYLWRHHLLTAHNRGAASAVSGFEPEPGAVPGVLPAPPGGRVKRTVKLVIGAEFDNEAEPIKWHIEGLFACNTVGLLFGDPGSYKSFIAVDLALHTATGLDWNGVPVKQGPVIYLAGEGHNGLKLRQRAWMAARDVQIEGVPIWWTEEAVQLLDLESANLVVDAIDDVVMQPEAQGMNPALIVIDTLAKSFSAGDENSSKDMGEFLNHIDTHLRHKYSAAVLIVHHTGHTEKGRARGSMALQAGVDFSYLTKRDAAAGDLMVKVSCTKMKDAEQPKIFHMKGQKVVVSAPGKKVITGVAFERCAEAVVDEVADAAGFYGLKGLEKKLFTLLDEAGGIVERGALTDMALRARFKHKQQVRSTLKCLVDKQFVCIEENTVKSKGYIESQGVDLANRRLSEPEASIGHRFDTPSTGESDVGD